MKTKLEASNCENFNAMCRYIIHLLYTNKTSNNVASNNAPGLVGEFIKKFGTKLMGTTDNLTLLVA